MAWFAHQTDGWEAESERALRSHDIRVERLELDQARALFPELVTDDLAFVLYELGAGVLRARQAVNALVDDALAAGASFIIGHAEPDSGSVRVEGTKLLGDQIVWASGAWTPGLFPGLMTAKVIRQEVLFVDAPSSWLTPPLPAWGDRELSASGLGDYDGRGFRIGLNRLGSEVDPDHNAGMPPESERAVREYLRRRFPSLADAPLRTVEAAPYTILGDAAGTFSIDRDAQPLVLRHPEHSNVWILGAGTGHGFKHAPALAEHLADALEGRESPYLSRSTDR